MIWKINYTKNIATEMHPRLSYALYTIISTVDSKPAVIDLGGFHHNVTMVVTDSIKLLIPTMDNFLGHFARMTGTYDQNEKMFLEGLVSEGQTIVEIGTNFGPYSVYMAKKVGAHGLMYCFEPFRLQYQLLTANIAINGLSNVITENFGVGDWPKRQIEADAPSFKSADNYGAASLVDMDRKTWVLTDSSRENVMIIPLDSYRFKGKIDLIKIDAEGMELEIVKGASNHIRMHSPIVYAENSIESIFSEDDFAVLMQKNFSYICSRPEDLTRHNIIVCYPGN